MIICVSLAIVTLLFDDNGKSNLDYKDCSRYDFASLAKMVQQRLQSLVNLHSYKKLLIPAYAIQYVMRGYIMN